MAGRSARQRHLRGPPLQAVREGMANQQRMKLEALRVSALPVCCAHMRGMLLL